MFKKRVSKMNTYEIIMVKAVKVSYDRKIKSLPNV